VVQRRRRSLDAVTCREINADHHGHLQASRQEICEVVLDSLLEIFKNNDPFFCSFLGKRKSVFSLLQSCKIEESLANDGVSFILVESQNDRLFRVMIAQLRLLDLQVCKPVVFTRFDFALIENHLLISLDLKEFPVSATLAEAEKGRADTQIAADQVEVDEGLSPSVDLLALEVHFSDEITIVNNLLGDPLLPTVKELPNSCFDSPDRKAARATGVKNLKEEFLSVCIDEELHSKKYSMMMESAKSTLEL
jgi:hypothetical protein